VADILFRVRILIPRSCSWMWRRVPFTAILLWTKRQHLFVQNQMFVFSTISVPICFTGVPPLVHSPLSLRLSLPYAIPCPTPPSSPPPPPHHCVFARLLFRNRFAYLGFWRVVQFLLVRGADAACTDGGEGARDPTGLYGEPSIAITYVSYTSAR
jgi:hypothetical protein